MLCHTQTCRSTLFGAPRTRRTSRLSKSLAVAAGGTRPHVNIAIAEKAVPTAVLSSKAEMPMIGLGTWRMSEDEVASAVKSAIETGYRHFDFAKEYGNQQGAKQAIANAIKSGLVKREDLFITSKLWNDSHGEKQVAAACKETMSELGLDYLDLYLVHWPVTNNPGPTLNPPYEETWKAMEALVPEGLVKSIGVSNLTVKKMEDVMSYAKIPPAVNQMEVQPYWRNDKVVNWCQDKGVHIQAYSPLGSPAATAENKKSPLALEDPKIVEIAQKLKKTPAQIVLRWVVQQGCSAIVKATANSHQVNDFNIFDWELPLDDAETIGYLDFQKRTNAGEVMLNEEGPYKTVADIWDGEGY